jgi:hypothetical protein
MEFLGSITAWYRTPSTSRPVQQTATSPPPILINSFERSEPTLHRPQYGWRSGDALTSSLCTYEQLDAPSFRAWAEAIRTPWRPHRKLWEYAYICQALDERGLLQQGKRGLGFAVGLEPLPALFASHGCTIVASDLPENEGDYEAWSNTGQWVRDLQTLNKDGLCPPAEFHKRVTFRPVNMNKMPRDLTGFDFTWSSCSFEHCGTLELGLNFLERQMDCLVPGGVAVHTTEFNLTSNDATVSKGTYVVYRLADIEGVCKRLRDRGHHVELLDLDVGEHELDRHVDGPPYSSDRHLRLELSGFASTSIGLIIRKGAA